MNKKALYEHIMRYVSKEIKKVLNEKNTIGNGIRYLYHATPSCYERSIKKYGLGGKIINRLWDYTNTAYQNIKIGCFLATDEYVAESYVETSEKFEDLCDWYEERYDKELKITVYQIDINDLDENLLSVDEN